VGLAVMLPSAFALEGQSSSGPRKPLHAFSTWVVQKKREYGLIVDFIAIQGLLLDCQPLGPSARFSPPLQIQPTTKFLSKKS